MSRALLAAAVLVVTGLWLTGCASVPHNPHNLCDVFTEKRSWYRAAKRAADRWGGPVHVPLAMMYQESGFKANAKPPRRWFLGFIPLGRVSSAYGYPQALKGTWALYQYEAGSRFSDRDNFADAIDFMFWYMDKTHRLNGISKWDAKNQYLSYHEGHGGYARGTYSDKPWLLQVAARVDARAAAYAAQFNGCRQRLDRNWFMRLFL